MATGVPANIIIPFVGVEFDSTAAFTGPATLPVTGLLIGQKLSGGTGTVETVIKITSEAQVITLAGEGSMAHKMAQRWFANNDTSDVYMILLDDDASGTQATTEHTISGTASETGSVVFYVDGRRIETAVASGDAAATVGAAVASAINAETDLPVTAAFSTTTLTLTARNDGVAAGDIDVRINALPGEATPAGLTVTPNSASTAGTNDPDVADALAAIGDEWFNVIVNPYDDTTNMDAIETFLATQAGPMIKKDGMCYQAKRDTLANLITFSTNAARNSQYMTLVPAYKRFEQTCQLAAGYAAKVAQSVQNDSGEPLHRMTLAGFRPLADGDKWTATERNSLAKAGVATLTDDIGVQTESTVTMYLKNSAGAADVAYQYQNTVFILMDLRYRFVQQILTKYPRARLADNADNIKPGISVMTPKRGEAEALIWFQQAQRDGLVEGLDDFKSKLVVARDDSNVNRMNWLLPPDLINQFIVGSGILQFRLDV